MNTEAAGRQADGALEPMPPFLSADSVAVVQAGLLARVEGDLRADRGDWAACWRFEALKLSQRSKRSPERSRLASALRANSAVGSRAPRSILLTYVRS